MPQDPQSGIQYPVGFQPYTPVQTPTPPSGGVQYPTNYEPYTPLPPPQQQSSGGIGDYFTIPNLLRMGVSTAGDFFGALVPPFYAPISYAGGALGEFLGQTFEDKPYNWGLMGVEGALNLVPGPNLPGKGAALGELAKYGVKATGYGMGQGALGATPRHIAETDKWELPSLNEFIGQTLAGGAAGGVTGGGLVLGKRGLEGIGRTPPLPREATPSYDVPLPPSPYNVPLPEFRQQGLPGMEGFQPNPETGLRGDYGPTPFQPTQPPTTRDLQGQGFAAIDARAQQQIFELTLDRAEAQRAGDSARVLAIEQAILETKMNAEAQKRNWTLPAEPPAPVFPGMPDAVTDQGDLSGFAWRQGGKFTQPGNIPPEMRQGVLGPEVTGGPRYPPSEPFTPSYPPTAPFNTEPPPREPQFTQSLPQEGGGTLGERKAEMDAATPELPKYVEISNMSDHEYINRWVGRGYLPGGPISANGFPQLVRPDVAPTTIPNVPKPPAVAPTRQGAFQPGERGAGQEQIVPASIVNNEYIAKMRKGGYEIAIRGPEEVVFRRVKEPIQSRVGGGNFSSNIRQILLRIFRPNQPLNAGSMGEFELRRAVADIVQETDRQKAYQTMLDWHERTGLARNDEDVNVISNLADLAAEKFNELTDATMRSPEAATSADEFTNMMNKAMEGGEKPRLADIINDIRTLAKQDTPENRAKTNQLVDLFERRIRAANPSARQMNHNETLARLEIAEKDPNSTPAELGLLRTLVNITEEVAAGNAPPVPMIPDIPLPAGPRESPTGPHELTGIERNIPFEGQGELPFGPMRELPSELRQNTRLEAIDQVSHDGSVQESFDFGPPPSREILQSRTGGGFNPRNVKEHPIVKKFRDGLPKADNVWDTRFILPDGTRLTHHEAIHEFAAQKVGTTLGTALESGVVRFTEGADGAEVGSPITMRQAEILADTPYYTKHDIYVDIRGSGGKYKRFDERSSADDIYSWVNSQYPRSIQSKVPPSQSRAKRIIESFHKVLEKANSWRQTRFIMPDGTRLTHNEDVHEFAANKAGTSLQGAMDSGIVRVAETFDGVEINAPITQAQAEVIADAVHYTGTTTRVDVLDPKGNRAYKVFGEDNTADDVYNWVNAHTRRSEEDIRALDMRAGREDLNDVWESMIHPTYTPGVGPRTRRPTVIYDKGIKLNEAEVTTLQHSPLMKKVQEKIDEVIGTIIDHSRSEILRENVNRTGVVLDPDSLGLYVPHPDYSSEVAILINNFEHWKFATPEEAATKMMETIYHELAHVDTGEPKKIFNPEEAANDPRLGSFLSEYLNQKIMHGEHDPYHDVNWMGRMIELQEKMGDFHGQYIKEFAEIFSAGKSGGYSPEVQKLLSIYSESRGRANTEPGDLASTGIKSATGTPTEGAIPSDAETTGDGTTPRPGFATRVKQATGWGQGSTEPPKVDPNKPSFVQELVNFPTNATTVDDLSFPGRQGLSQIFTPEFWKAIGPSISAGSRNRADVIDAQLKNKELFQDRVNVMTGEVKPSIAKEAGLDLMALGHRVGPREEATSSRWLENGAFLGPESATVGGVKIPNPFRFLYKYSVGGAARVTNRIFTTWGNHLRANRFEKLMNLSRNMAMVAESGRGPAQGIFGGYQLQSGKNIGFRKDYTPEQAADLNPFFNKMRAKEIAEFVNTATGRGPLKMHILPFRQTQVSLESSAKTLSMVMFAPRNTASRMRMLNPNTYIMASPFVRRQYLKAALATASAWWIFTEMAKLADPRHVKVSHDLTSADFGKVRIGDFRMDAAGGFQQFLVAYARLYQGGAASSSTGKFNEFGKGFQAQTQFDMGERLFSNKLNPVAKFAWDLAHASEYNPFHVADRSVQLFVPLIVQDFVEIQKEDPNLLMPWMVPILFGAGSQIYSKGESIHKFIPPKQDWIMKGGGLIDLMPKGVQNLWDKSGRF